MNLKEKQIEMIISIAKLRFMNTSQIHQLHGGDGKYSDIVTRKKLRELETKGYLKSWQPSKYEQKVFYITKMCADTLSAYTGEPYRYFKKSDKVNHQVMVSEVYTVLHKYKNGRLRYFMLNYKAGEVISDALITIDLPERQRKVFFLEVDTGKENIGYIKNVKIKQYHDLWISQEIQQKMSGHFPDIVFVTLSDTRKRCILNIAKDQKFKIKCFTLDELLSYEVIAI